MTRIHVMVEGQTEETFVRELMVGTFATRGIYLFPFLFSTSPGHKGGVISYGKIRHQIQRKCREDRGACVTTMIDLYGLPHDFPGYNETLYLPLYERVSGLEAAFYQDIGEPNFRPNLVVHEFEGLLFTDVTAFEEWSFDDHAVAALQQQSDGFETPEHVNDSPQSAPSKRILSVLDDYQKPVHGPLIALQIGLDKIRQSCPHFRQWLEGLENFAAPEGGAA
jgi:hypothetical protein